MKLISRKLPSPGRGIVPQVASAQVVNTANEFVGNAVWFELNPNIRHILWWQVRIETYT